MTQNPILTVSPSMATRIAALLFFLSGAAGLIYEVVWARQLTLFLGVTAFAHTAVVTAFLAGLAVGAIVFGRLADRRSDPLRLYAILELVIGAWALATPWIFQAIQGIYLQLSSTLGWVGPQAQALRFGLALLALFVPTALMGGTLPLLIRALTGSVTSLSRTTSWLYGINTLGATVGCFAAGYLMLPSLGIRGSVFLAAALNLTIGVVAWVVLPHRGRGREGGSGGLHSLPPKEVEPRPGDPDELGRGRSRLLLIGFAVSGFAALVYQLAWIRVLHLVIGSSVYAFSATLTTFLAGLALGSLLWNRLSSMRGWVSVSARLREAAWLELLTAVFAVAGLRLVGWLPQFFLQGAEIGMHQDFGRFQLLIFSLSALLMLPATLALGALFPLVTALWVRDATALGRGVGSAYAVNTGGTILGALVGGLVLLPWLGVQTTLIVGAVLHFSMACAFRIAGSAGAQRLPARWLGFAAVGFVWLVFTTPPWDRELMTAGVFFNPDRTLADFGVDGLRAAADRRQMLFYQEGVDGVVSVIRSGESRTLLINGKPDASSGADLPTQVLLGQLPMLLHPSPRSAMVIGMGSGVTAGSVATHSGVETLQVIEISKEVVAAARFFEPENGGVLDDRRLEVVYADARNHLLTDNQRWDVIISEPSNPWLTGVANLFTLEAFELLRSRVAEGGLVAQWFHTYNMSQEDLRSVFRTFHEIFPHVSVWNPSSGDLILIGSLHVHSLDYPRLVQAFAQEGVSADLGRIEIRSLDQLVLTYLLDTQGLEAFAGDTPLNTDDRPRLEFGAPRNLYKATTELNLRDLTSRSSQELFVVPVRRMVVRSPAGFDAGALNLSVRTNSQPDGSEWEATWLIGRAVLSDEDSGTVLVGTSSRRDLRWLDEGVEMRVQAVWLETHASPDRLLGALQQVLGAEKPVGDVIAMPCGTEGLWGAVRDGERGDVALALVWPSAEPSHDLYVAFRRFDRSFSGDLLAAAVEFASRFACQRSTSEPAGPVFE